MARNRFMDDEVYEERFDLRLLKRLLSYARPYAKNLVVAMVIMALAVLLSLAGPLITRYIVDEIIPAQNYRALLIAAGVLIVTIVLSILLMTLKGIMMTKTGHSAIYDLRKQVFDHLQEQSFDYFDNRPTGKILVRVTNYVDALASLLSDGIVNMITEILTLVVIIFLMFSISPQLTMVSIAMFIPLTAVVIIFEKVLHKHYRVVNNKNSNRTSYVHENIMGAKVIQAFVRERINQDTYRDLNESVKTTWLRAFNLNSLLWPSIDLLSVIGIAGTYFLGYVLLGAQLTTLGTIIAFTVYISRFWTPINNLSAIYNQLLNAMAYIERIFETLDTEPGIKDAPDAEELPPVEGNVSFQDVTFSYENGHVILDRLSFDVKKGQTVAFVGPSGGGKTTVISLLSRFYDVDSGRIMIDGHDISKVTLRSLRSQMGIIMQDSFIFEGTIMDNIRYGRLDATDEEVIEAAKTAYADEFISRLPNGYHTYVDERGSSLSTGERQLLSFARVILSDPKILVLDEATSCIDTKTEENIQKALDVLLRGRTSFIIAHRLSTIRNVDKIMVVGGRKIMEEGTHDELIDRKGTYYELHKAQYQNLA